MSTSRPALDRMLSKLRPGDTVIVARFTRLGRSRDHLIHLLGEFFRKGIHFKALDLGVYSARPAGKLVLQIFAALAEYDGTGRPAGEPAGKDPGGSVAGYGQRQTHRSAEWRKCRAVS